jgi:hypothetical protein
MTMLTRREHSAEVQWTSSIKRHKQSRPGNRHGGWLGREESNEVNAWRRVDAPLATGLPCTLSENAETRDIELDWWRLTSTPQKQAAKHAYSTSY